MAQYDAKRDVTQLKKCIDALLDVSIVCFCSYLMCCAVGFVVRACAVHCMQAQTSICIKPSIPWYVFVTDPIVTHCTSSQDPNKVVNMIVDNVTLARPLFNNPVGNGVYTFW